MTYSCYNTTILIDSPHFLLTSSLKKYFTVSLWYCCWCNIFVWHSKPRSWIPGPRIIIISKHAIHIWTQVASTGITFHWRCLELKHETFYWIHWSLSVWIICLSVRTENSWWGPMWGVKVFVWCRKLCKWIKKGLHLSYFTNLSSVYVGLVTWTSRDPTILKY